MVSLDESVISNPECPAKSMVERLIIVLPSASVVVVETPLIFRVVPFVAPTSANEV